MALDIRKWFIPFSVANRGRKTSVQKNNVDGIIYNDALSISKMFTEVNRSQFARTNYSAYDEVTTTGGGEQSNALALSNKGYHIVTTANDAEAVKLPKYIDTMIVYVHNLAGENTLVLFPSEGDKLNGGLNDSIVINPGDTAKVIAISDTNWIVLFND
jgi:hypothetical protein